MTGAEVDFLSRQYGLSYDEGFRYEWVEEVGVDSIGLGRWEPEIFPIEGD